MMIHTSDVDNDYTNDDDSDSCDANDDDSDSDIERTGDYEEKEKVLFSCC